MGNKNNATNNQSLHKRGWLRSKQTGIIAFGLFFAVIGVLAVFRSFAATTAEFYVTPATTSVTAGQSFAVQVRINPGTTVDTVDVHIGYNPAVLQYVSADSSTSPFTTQVVANGGNGDIALTRTVLAPGSVSSDALIATVTFTALASNGTVPLTLTGNVAYQGAAVTSTTTNGSVTVGAPADTTAPAVTITSPASGAGPGKLTIAATATDNVAVTKMEIYIDYKLTASSTTGKISYLWNDKASTSKKGQPAPSHTIVVKAYDAAGNVGSASVTTK